MTGYIATTLVALISSCSAFAVSAPAVAPAVPEVGGPAIAPAVAAPTSAVTAWCDQIVIIGDSLTARGNGALHATFPDAIINARGGRVTGEGREAAVGVHESNRANCWVFALGTNDVFYDLDPVESAAAIADLLAIASGRIWWVMPEFAPWSGYDAAEFNALVPTWVNRIYPYTPHAEFAWDGIHLGAAGYDRRAATIAQAITGN